MTAAETIRQELLAMRNEEQRTVLMRFFKTGKGQYGEGDQFLGIKVPQTRDMVKRHWRECTLGDIEELICSEYHEIRLCALLLLVKMFAQARKDSAMQQAIVEFYLSHTQYINNWDLVDLSCYEILGRWLLDKDRTMLYTLAREGKTIWEQRIGMVSCMAFVRQGQVQDCLAIADILLYHKHDLIHKAVGWLLREVGKKDMPALVEWLEPRAATMPRTVLRYAIERFEPDARARMMTMGKNT